MNELKKKLLFIDDDPTFLAAQSAFMSSHGYAVLTADGTDAAIAVLQKETPDMIFIDLMMEHTDSGFTLARRIRREERFQGIPLVMLSGVASETGLGFSREREELKSWSHLDDFVDKPVSAHRLLAIVEQRLGEAEDKSKER
jgi:CheY-like chemotaxis protein